MGIAFISKVSDYAAYRVAAKALVNTAAGEAQASLVSSSPMQSYVDAQLYTEAKAYETAPLASYPWMQAIADEMGTTKATVYSRIMTQKTLADAILQAIEAVRMSTMKQIDDADDSQLAIDAIVTAAQTSIAVIVSTYT
ncbi:hypothetical protein ACFODL_15590 [Phenylobacterium terrae]|uniref:Uncharacterized protein n=1 Tax=Phenylobacterium terrae TaxID=2665495 RepID=A0ABW4N796_9CAUL